MLPDIPIDSLFQHTFPACLFIAQIGKLRQTFSHTFPFIILQITEQRKSRAEALIHSMSSHVKSWQEKLRVCQYHAKTLIGDALLTAACICYLGPMEQERREQLLNDWKTVCQGKTEEDDEVDDDTCVTTKSQSYGQTRYRSTSTSFPVGIDSVPCRSDFSLKEIMSSKEELYTWQNAGLSVDCRAIENALTIRAVCDKASRHWPLLVDTDLQSYAWVKCFHENKVNEGTKNTIISEALILTPLHLFRLYEALLSSSNAL